MRRRSLIYLYLLLCAAGQVKARAQGASPREVLDRYCVSCHNEKLKTAGLMLDKADVAHPGSSPGLWEKVRRKLRTLEMPPPGRPRPDAATYATMSAFIEDALDKASSVNPNPGRVAVHRLNRTEYKNAI